MLNRDLAIGTQVYLQPESTYYATPSSRHLNPLNTIGTVTQLPDNRSSLGVYILWSDRNYIVWYGQDTWDFILADDINNGTFETRKEAREFAKKNGFVVVDLGKDKSPRWTVGVKEV